MPWVVKKLFPQYIWDKKDVVRGDKVIYLSFDDGPVPEITPWVLETLAAYNARATFFMIGDNVRKHQDLFIKVALAGHSIGNHTYNHLNGWKTETTIYLDNVNKAQEEMRQAFKRFTIATGENSTIEPTLFRPPYGKLSRKQSKAVQKRFKIVLYDVLAYDWDSNTSAKTCTENVIHYSKPGSIVLFHDSIKAAQNLKKTLPEILEHFTALGYRFEAL